jgi:hypothetical protein
MRTNLRARLQRLEATASDAPRPINPLTRILPLDTLGQLIDAVRAVKVQRGIPEYEDHSCELADLAPHLPPSTLDEITSVSATLASNPTDPRLLNLRPDRPDMEEFLALMNSLKAARELSRVESGAIEG